MLVSAMTNRLVTLISVGDHLTAMFQLGKQDLSQQLDIKLFYLAFELLLERLAESIGKGYLAVPFLKKIAACLMKGFASQWVREKWQHPISPVSSHPPRLRPIRRQLIDNTLQIPNVLIVYKCTTTRVPLKNVGIWKVYAALSAGLLISCWKRTWWGETPPCKRDVTAGWHPWEPKRFGAVADSLIYHSQKSHLPVYSETPME